MLETVAAIKPKFDSLLVLIQFPTPQKVCLCLHRKDVWILGDSFQFINILILQQILIG